MGLDGDGAFGRKRTKHSPLSTTARITNLVYLTPFLSLCFLRLVIGEPIHPATAAGLALIVLSLFFQEYRTRRA